MNGDIFYNSDYYIFDNGQWVKTSFLSTVDAFTFYIQSNQASHGESFGINLIDNTVIDLAVTGHGDNDGGWAFIASPVVDDIAPSVVENLEGVKYQTGTYNYDLYRFNQSADLEWENYHSHDTQENPFMLENGKGYLYASKNDRTLHFNGNFNTNSSKTVDLEYDANAVFAGWNLVGNPFPVQAWADKSYYTMNNEGTGLVANEVASSTPIPPLTGVMIQATAENQTVTFSTMDPGQQNANNNGGLQIALSQANTRSNALLDNAVVSFNEGSELGKFYFGSQNANVYIPQDGEDYAIVSTEMQGEIPVNFKAKVDGEYTISVTPENVELDYLHLIDKKTGADVDLLSPAGSPFGKGAGEFNEPSYSFSAKTTDSESRFKLVFRNEESLATSYENFAYLNNGCIVLACDYENATMQIVDVLGRVMRQEAASGQMSASGIPAGVYVLRLITKKEMKVQKIVIQ